MRAIPIISTILCALVVWQAHASYAATGKPIHQDVMRELLLGLAFEAEGVAP